MGQLLRKGKTECYPRSDTMCCSHTLACISDQADLNFTNMSEQTTPSPVPRLFLDRQSGLFGSWPTLALHLGRSPLTHSYGYGSAADQPICFARATQDSESW